MISYIYHNTDEKVDDAVNRAINQQLDQLKLFAPEDIDRLKVQQDVWDMLDYPAIPIDSLDRWIDESFDEQITNLIIDHNDYVKNSY